MCRGDISLCLLVMKDRQIAQTATVRPIGASLTDHRSTETFDHLPQFYQQQLAHLIAESRGFSVAEDANSVTLLLSDWLPALRRILWRALELLDGLEATALEAKSAGAAWSRSNETLILPQLFEELADLCFIAGAESRASLKELEPLDDESGPWVVIVALEGAQTRLSRSLCAVEARLARISGLRSQTRHVDLGRQSLRARKLAARLRQRLSSVVRHGECDIEKRVRSLGTSLAWLLGHDHFSDLRASNRFLVRELHERTVGWLRNTDSTEDGERLCCDAEAFIDLLPLINRRPEVVQHDFKIVLGALELLADADPHATLPSAMVAPLRKITGRDEPLDRMLAEGAPSGQVSSRLLELHALLERDGATSGDPERSHPSGMASGLTIKEEGKSDRQESPSAFGSASGTDATYLAYEVA